MSKLFQLCLVLLTLFTLNARSTAQDSQTTISGSIIEQGTDQGVIGANVYIKGSTIGTVTDLDGSFRFKTTLSGDQVLVISSVGMLTIEKTVTLNSSDIELGKIEQESDAVGLAEVMVFADVAIDRQTPVAVSNVKPELIEAKLGNQEFPEILKSTPGIYATKQGGAFGDSRVNIRGFNARYVAVMINGMPVNDMENGWVYWSNWAGLSDVTRSMQVQRGLGAAKVAIPSVGGTINILTKTTDAEKGGKVTLSTGNDGYNKIGLTLSSGLTEKNWATSFSLSKSGSKGYVDGTQYEAYSYFLNVSKIINDNHRMSFSLFGAPQWHGQRSTKMGIDTYKDPLINSTKYNSDWGYKNGEVYHVRRNFYHKPQGILNHFWKVNERMHISTAAYVSTGTGGGTGPLQYSPLDGEADVKNRFYGADAFKRENQIEVDKIVDENIDRGAQGSGNILRASVNNHFWTGILPQVKYRMDWITLSGGLDLRYYKGEHYREVEDLLGGQYYLDRSDKNNPDNETFAGDKIAYYNDGIVSWYGAFGQAEATYGKLNAFVAGSLSLKGYKRVDYFNYLTGNQTSDLYNFLGYSIKGGANYNLTDNHNIFFNAGYFQNPPDFGTVFYKYTNDANKEAPNEKLSSVELGYGFRSGILSANINGYYTLWKDKAEIIRVFQDDVEYVTNLTGIDATHMGIEVDFVLRPTDKLKITGMASLGDWKWANDLKDVPIFDDNQNLIKTENIFIKDIHVGDAAQNTAALGIDYEFLKGFFVGADYNFYDRLFAEFNPEDRTSAPADGEKNPDSWKVPTYQLVDLNVRYKFNIGEYKSTLIGNINNLLDAEYISDADDGLNHNWKDASVFYGWGRSWVITLKINF